LSSNADTFLIQHQQEIIALGNRFGSYVTGVHAPQIGEYLRQFGNDIELGLKIIQNVDFYDSPRLVSLSHDLLNIIRLQTNQNLDNVLFCPMSTYSGDSSNSTARLLRMSIGGSPAERRITRRLFLNNVFDLQKLSNDTETKQIFFIDHFSGSGNTILRTWGGIRQWENDNHKYFVGLLVAYDDVIETIESESNSVLQVICPQILPAISRAFHPDNHTFSESEKLIIQEYCIRVEPSSQHRFGHNNSQSLIIFHNRASNNAIPILHKSTNNWTPLFPRYLS